MELPLLDPLTERSQYLEIKASARILADSLDIPILKGVSLDQTAKKTPFEQCSSLGLPLMLKATGTGGGRAMRKVFVESEFNSALQQVNAEAILFGSDGEIIAERLLESARHIEAQLCGFQDGSVIHLGERDCSAQRRFQKLIEESPALGLDPQLRLDLLSAAVKLTKEAGLQSLATAEFLVTENEFYFLEINPRLQVEHTVTEEVTGLDLVELQIRAASEKAYNISQDEISFSGAAIEIRIVSESPEQNYMPSAQVVDHFFFPKSIRVDHALTFGVAPNLDYDSLLAKIICHAESTAEVRKKCIEAMNNSWILGPATTIPFLTKALGWKKPYTIDYLTSNHTALVEQCVTQQQGEINDLAGIATVAAYFLGLKHRATVKSQVEKNEFAKGLSAFSELSNFGRSVDPEITVDISSDSIIETKQEAQLLIKNRPNANKIVIGLRDREVDVSLIDTLDHVYKLELRSRDQARIAIVSLQTNVSISALVSLNGYSFAVSQQRPIRSSSNNSGFKDLAILAKLPGSVVSIAVKPGDTIEIGQPLLTLESMKMEHQIISQRNAHVEIVHTSVGKQVERGQLLITLAPTSKDTQ
ncbi:UNVERIFIED_CONTAM: hypothetical protein GTU68_015988 [Idotea baltica]|nr:hypothetical protein [Idotea baltica]